MANIGVTHHIRPASFYKPLRGDAISTSNGKLIVDGRLLVVRINQQWYKVHNVRSCVRSSNTVQKKAILYKYILGCSGRTEEVYVGSSQVHLTSNGDNI